MKIAPLADVKARFSRYVERCQESPVMVTKNGRPAALLVSVPEDEEELERFILAHTPKFRRLIDSAAKRIRKRGGVSHDDFWKGRAAPRARAGDRAPSRSP